MSTTNTLDLNNRVDALENFSHNVEPIQQQIDELKAWTDSGTKDASGNPIILTDGAAFNAVDLKVSCNPKQNLHGYDHPWAGGAGKNKLPMTVDNIKSWNTGGTWSGNAYTLNGVTFTVLTDEDDNVTGVKVTGTASAAVTLNMLFTGVNATQYTLTGCPSSGSTGTYYLDTLGTNISRVVDVGSGVSFTANATEQYVRIGIMSGYAIPTAGLMFYPMIRLASVSDATFAPYTNECPITGYTECAVDVKDEDETTQDNVTIAFGQTVYGCNVDAKSGKVTVKYALVDLGTLTWTIQPTRVAGINRFRAGNMVSIIKPAPQNNVIANIISSVYKAITAENTYMLNDGDGIGVDTSGSIFIYDSTRDTLTAEQFKAAMDGVHLCYELATPIELTLTPAELELIKGYNYITTNGDNIELTYQPDNLKADIMLTVSQLYGSKISIFDGILAGGDTGQVLTKTSNDDYDVAWETLPATRTNTRKSEK